MPSYSSEQLKNARTIVAVAKSLKISARGQAMGLACALVEANLKNVNYGDKDSLGLFQQRAPWGSAAQRTNPEWAARAFFVGTRNSNGWFPGLTSYGGWENRSFTEAITAVQHPAKQYESRYGERQAEAEALLRTIVGSTPPAPLPGKPPAPGKPPIPGGKAPAFPLTPGSYFGPEAWTARSVSGYHGHSSDLRKWQQKMADRGWGITVNGFYGVRGQESTGGNCGTVAKAFQAEKGLPADGLIGPATWAAAWTAPIT